MWCQELLSNSQFEGTLTSSRSLMKIVTELHNVKQLDIVQAVIGLSATGLISLIVLALSEIVGTDVNLTVKIVQKERKAEQKKVSNTGQIDGIEPAGLSLVLRL